MSEATQQRLSRRELVLGQFDPSWTASLLEFAKDIARADAEAYVFMARKSLCLYDVLVGLGAPPVERALLSDRALDCDLEGLHGKRIMLVDDTLILGTTLAKAQRRLARLPGTTIESVVFCRNTDWSDDRVFRPDRVYLDLPDHGTQTFCASEVLAFSLFPRPYVSDFPMLGPLRVRDTELQSLLSATEFATRNLSSSLQQANDVSVFTFFPGQALVDELRRSWGPELASLVDLVKVRAFGRRSQDATFFQVVPVVTLKPLQADDIAGITEHLLGRLAPKAGTDTERVLHDIRTPVAQQRLIGYLLGASLGRRWLGSTERDLQREVPAQFNQIECDRLFGPWVGPAVQRLSEATDLLLEPAPATPVRWIPAKPPAEALALAGEALPEMTSAQCEVRADQDLIVADFCRAFLRLYDAREIPARNEVRRLGALALDAGPDEAPNRDRLEFGLAWSSLLDWFCTTYGAGRGTDTTATLSLVLDICNDLGIAVPVTSYRDGVVMRGYRHGEDVKFADSEPDLVLSMVHGFLEGAGREDIPRLWMEKLLVMLLSIGSAKGFVKPLYGETSMPGSVRVKFNLKGAISMITTGPRSVADGEQWLSRYLLERGVLKLNSKRLFVPGSSIASAGVEPGEPVNGAQATVDAVDQAFAIGNISGALLAGIEEDPPALVDNDLVVLTTCHPPRHAAGAIATELSIFEMWWGREGQWLLACPSRDPRESLRTLVASKGHEAVHSSRFKFIAYRDQKHLEVIERGAKALARGGPGYRLMARTWSTYWAVADTTRNVQEQNLLGPALDAAMRVVWALAVGLGLGELSFAVQDRLESGGRRRAAVERAREKIEEFDTALEQAGVLRPAGVSTLLDAVAALEGGGDPAVARQVAATVVGAVIEEVPLRAQGLQREVDSFGRLAARHEYTYMLWYDVVDSTATEAAAAGADIDEHRRQVFEFKQGAIVILQQISHRAQRRNAGVFAWNGDIISGNDEKHLFFSGKFAARWLMQFLESLMIELRSTPAVRIRAHVLPCNFVGTAVYRYMDDAEVTGERFWEHGSRLRKQLREIERTHDGAGSFFAMVGTMEMPETLRWSGRREVEIETQIAGLSRRTSVRHGRLQYNASTPAEAAS